ncbi:uncharacterized protein BJ212DRAFT_1298051 [Suillus subaureus]|uniref:Uncharacterized protein n=1 Tax=Suillus subaureus TaxID=48587 RepID=A0A9P7JFQ2_9AGAM|nr:uncharacterized protein BJ212DRAFT_1298051 [Suillus subaureus]KAG1819581.1 hypothetical protein BJ212DRAFT_1298051 [Suillus subaureus]
MDRIRPRQLVFLLLLLISPLPLLLSLLSPLPSQLLSPLLSQLLSLLLQQMPLLYSTPVSVNFLSAPAGPDEGEVFDLNNVSGDEEEPENLAAPTAMVPVGSNLSPLQTITSTVCTDPLATGNLKQPKGPTDINHFYWIDPDMKSKTCIPCKSWYMQAQHPAQLPVHMLSLTTLNFIWKQPSIFAGAYR